MLLGVVTFKLKSADKERGCVCMKSEKRKSAEKSIVKYFLLLTIFPDLMLISINLISLLSLTYSLQ